MSASHEHPSAAKRAQSVLPRWSDKVGRVVLRQGSRLLNLGQSDGAQPARAANTPQQLWQELDALTVRIDGIAEDHRQGAAQLNALQADGFGHQPEDVLRLQYDRLGGLLARIADIEGDVADLIARLENMPDPTLPSARSARRQIRRALADRDARLKAMAQALRRYHVELSAQLIEFR